MEQLDDILLLKAVSLHRDATAFTILCLRYQGPAFNLAFRVLRNAAQAEDAVQEAMLSIWLSPKLDDVEDARKWILSVVMNKSLNLALSQKQRLKREECTAVESHRLPDAIEDTVDKDEQIRILREHVDRLPELECQILSCHYGAGMSIRAIAKLVNLSHPTVSSRIEQILARLRADLAKAGIASALLLSADNLHNAVSGGHASPAGLIAKIQSRMAEGTTSIAGSKQVVASSSRKVSVIAVPVFIVAACGSAWLVTRDSDVVPAEVAVNALFSRKWSFDSPEDSRAFRIVQGAWQHVVNGGVNSTGCMETKDIVVSIDLPLKPDRCLAIQWKYAPLNRDSKSHASWERQVGWARLSGFDSLPMYRSGEWLDISTYVTDCSVDKWVGKARNTLYFTPKQTSSSTVGICLIGHQRIDELTIREIPASEVPDFSPYRAAVEKIEPAKRVGIVALSELKSSATGKPITVKFLPPDSVNSSER
jgi:RNA polymerase sigma-70 factor, ECF subfamily